MIRTAWRRWLGFLAEHYPDDLLKFPRTALHLILYAT